LKGKAQVAAISKGRSKKPKKGTAHFFSFFVEERFLGLIIHLGIQSRGKEGMGRKEREGRKKGS